MYRSISRFLILLLAGMLSLALFPSCGSDDGASGTSCGIGGTKCDYGCLPNLGCAECASNEDCSEPGKPACMLGKCRECGSQVSCGSANACYPKDFKCDTRCTGDGDCPGDAAFCVAESGACVGCQVDSDCAATPKTPICEPTRAQCSECRSDRDCGAAAPACDLNDGKCHECLVDANCPRSTLCGVDRKCHSACVSNADCSEPGKPFCEPASKDCVACLVDANCPQAEPVCSSGKCQACLIDGDCTDPTLPICKGDTCVQCDKDDDCTDPDLPTCSGHECTSK